MNAPVLLRTFDSVYLVALAAWVGSVLFLSFGVAPIIFRALGPDPAATFVRALFPRYYAWGVTTSALALASLVCGALSHPELRGLGVGVQAGVILACCGIFLYCGNVLTPAINAARDAGPDSAPTFDRLHNRSVQLNGVVLLAGLGLLVAFAARTPLRTVGIEEPPALTGRPG